MIQKLAVHHLQWIALYLLFMLSCTAGGQELTSGSKQQATPEQVLFNALRSGDLTQVKAKIASGIDINIRYAGGDTPLHITAAEGGLPLKPNTEVLEYLIAQGADLEAKNHYCGATPLYSTVLNGQIGAAIFLIASGADVNAQDHDGLTPLDAATGRLEIMKLLKDNGARTANLPAAACLGDLTRVKILIITGKQSANPQYKNVRIKSPLMLAAAEGHNNIVEFLLSKGANLHSEWVYGGTALHFAARNGHMATVKLLLDKGADINFKSGDMQNTPLSATVETGRITMLELLISKGAEVNPKLENDAASPLHRAVVGRHPQVTELLIKNGADIEVKTTFGHRPLHMAAMIGQLEHTKILIKHGAQVNAKNDSGNTPLSVALINGREDVAAYLRKHGGREKNGAG